MKRKMVTALLLSIGLTLSTVMPVAAADLTPEEAQAKIETLESEKTDLEKELSDLQSQIDALTSENEELKRQIEGQDGEAESAAESTKTDTVGTVYTDVTTTKVVQEALNAAGYNCGTPDGVAGKKTTEAISAYESAKGINVNGVITDELLDSMGIADEIKAAAEREASKADYGSDYTYEQLARNPDTYIGQKVRLSGKVLQAETSDTISYLRLAVNSDYNTVIFVTYDSSVLSYRLLEDDIVTVYGVSAGVYSYEAVSGATITLPWLHADMIEM